MNKGKIWIIISSVSMLVLSALTIFFIVLKHGESDLRKLYQGYFDLGLWLIVIWQIVIVAICIFLWARVFRNVPDSALSRNDALGKLVTAAFNFQPPPMPAFTD